MRLIYIVLFGFSINLLGGCSSWWPKYTPPDTKPPSTWSTFDPQTKIEQQNVSTLAWWKRFKNSELDALIDCALRRNNELHIAAGNLKLARASLQKIHMSWFPTLGAGYVTYGGTLENFGWVDSQGKSLFESLIGRKNLPYYGYSSGFIPNYTINLLAQWKQEEIAKLDVAKQIELTHAVRLTTIGQVVVSYFTLLGLREQLQIQNELLADLKSMRQYVQIDYQAGATSEMPLKSINQNIANIRKVIPLIKDSIVQAENSLRVLTNRNPGHIHTTKSFSSIQTNQIIPINLPAVVIKTRPDVVIAEYQLQQANATIAEAASQFFPIVNLSGFLGNSPFQFTNLFTIYTNVLNAELGAAMPLIDMSILADIKRAKAGRYTAFYHYMQTIRYAFAEVDNSLSKHKAINESYRQQAIVVSESTAQYRLANIQYQAGSISYSSTLSHRFNLHYAKAYLNKLKLQQLNSLVSLYFVLGGGATACEKPKCLVENNRKKRSQRFHYFR